jgi:hypothetical protein
MESDRNLFGQVYRCSQFIQQEIAKMSNHTHECPGCGVEIICGCAMPDADRWCGDFDTCDIAEGKVEHGQD